MQRGILAATLMLDIEKIYGLLPHVKR